MATPLIHMQIRIHQFNACQLSSGLVGYRANSGLTVPVLLSSRVNKKGDNEKLFCKYVKSENYNTLFRIHYELPNYKFNKL